MKKRIIGVITALALLTVGLTACGDDTPRPKSKWEMCVDAGGSPRDHGFGTDCIFAEPEQ